MDNKEKNYKILKHSIIMYNVIYNFYSHYIFIILICIILFIIYLYIYNATYTCGRFIELNFTQSKG